MSQCLLVLERLCLWVSGGEELCVWNEDFQLRCHRQNHSDTGEERRNETDLRLCSLHMQPINVVFGHFAGIVALIELPKNCIAAAMDKEIGERIVSCRRERSRRALMAENAFHLSVIYRVTLSTDSTVSAAEIRCLSDHQDQIRALINVDGQSLQGGPEIFVKSKCVHSD